MSADDTHNDPKPNLKRKLANNTVTNSTSQTAINGLTLEALECPICMELPRSPPIFNCKDCGHLLCKDCKLRITTCPMCRSPDLSGRNQFAERLLDSVLAVTPIDCRNRNAGCTVRDLADRVAQHEKICVYRQIACPGIHRRACKWAGPLSKMLLHVIESKCAQIVKSRESDAPFTSVIGDFNAAEMTAFGRAAMTHWKPVLFISRQIIRLFAYLVSYRDEKGNWILYLRSYASAEALDKLQASITVRRPNDSNIIKNNVNKSIGNTTTNININNAVVISFTGSIVPHDLTEQQVLESGNFLCLKDSQVRKMCVDRTLFEYSVEIKEKAV